MDSFAAPVPARLRALRLPVRTPAVQACPVALKRCGIALDLSVAPFKLSALSVANCCPSLRSFFVALCGLGVSLARVVVARSSGQLLVSLRTLHRTGQTSAMHDAAQRGLLAAQRGLLAVRPGQSSSDRCVENGYRFAGSIDTSTNS
jgi:hypothetical protein